MNFNTICCCHGVAAVRSADANAARCVTAGETAYAVPGYPPAKQPEGAARRGASRPGESEVA